MQRMGTLPGVGPAEQGSVIPMRMQLVPIAAVEDVVFRISSALRVPVLAIALIALALVVVELGALIVELVRHRRRNAHKLQGAAGKARGALAAGDGRLAASYLAPATSSASMWRACHRVLTETGQPEADVRVPKSIADFDIDSLRRLERTRLLVRAGPALGL